jgi:hypothetical protein
VLSQWTVKQKQEWLSDEIKVFLQTYVFQFTSAALEAFSTGVTELSTQEKDGYACRVCDQNFKYHSTRVKYVHLIIKLILS